MYTSSGGDAGGCKGLERDFDEGRAGAYARVAALTRLGERDAALELLREAVRRREPYVVWLATDERHVPLRELPGFRALVRELRLRPVGDIPEGDETQLPVSR